MTKVIQINIVDVHVLSINSIYIITYIDNQNVHLQWLINLKCKNIIEFVLNFIRCGFPACVFKRFIFHFPEQKISSKNFIPSIRGTWLAPKP